VPNAYNQLQGFHFFLSFPCKRKKVWHYTKDRANPIMHSGSAGARSGRLAIYFAPASKKVGTVPVADAMSKMKRMQYRRQSACGNGFPFTFSFHPPSNQPIQNRTLMLDVPCIGRYSSWLLITQRRRQTWARMVGKKRKAGSYPSRVSCHPVALRTVWVDIGELPTQNDISLQRTISMMRRSSIRLRGTVMLLAWLAFGSLERGVLSTCKGQVYRAKIFRGVALVVNVCVPLRHMEQTTATAGIARIIGRAR
jgi:hypothetical protein